MQVFSPLPPSTCGCSSSLGITSTLDFVAAIKLQVPVCNHVSSSWRCGKLFGDRVIHEPNVIREDFDVLAWMGIGVCYVLPNTAMSRLLENLDFYSSGSPLLGTTFSIFKYHICPTASQILVSRVCSIHISLLAHSHNTILHLQYFLGSYH